jgi:hypothetical protein
MKTGLFFALFSTLSLFNAYAQIDYTSNNSNKLTVDWTAKKLNTYGLEVTGDHYNFSKVTIDLYSQKFYSWEGDQTVRIDGGEHGLMELSNHSARKTLFLHSHDNYHKGGAVGVKRGDIDSGFPVSMAAGPNGNSFNLDKFTSNGTFADGAKLISTIFAGDTEAMTGLQLNTSNSAVVIGNWLGYERNKGYGLINKFKTKFENDLYVTNGGSIGIGTNAPQSKLHLKRGGSSGTPHYFSALTVEDSNNSMISILTPNDKVAYFGFSDNDDNYVGGMQYEHATDRLIFRANNRANDLTIASNGNVGIGSSTPDSKLTVAGKVHAREVKVAVNAGADFVFADGYKLPKLEQLEQFVKTNKHLPEIASEKEMQQNGLLLAEMNIKLLQKVEELTLYTIQQEKKLTVQEKQLKVQQEVNAKLEARLLKIEAALLEQD